MGILDSIVGGVTRNIQSGAQSAVNNAVYGATTSATRAVQGSITNAVKSATINPDDLIKKISFSKNQNGGYDIFFEAKPLNPITANDLKMMQGKARKDALPILKMFLRGRHDAFKTDKVAVVIGERILDDMGVKQ